MTELYRAIDLTDISADGESSEPVQYVGVYVLRWGNTEHPEIGFIPMDVDVDKAAAAPLMYEALIAITGAFYGGLEWVGPDTLTAMQMGETALAKARGESND
jgi:hypothetical protein